MVFLVKRRFLGRQKRHQTSQVPILPVHHPKGQRCKGKSTINSCTLPQGTNSPTQPPNSIMAAGLLESLGHANYTIRPLP